MGYSKSGLAAQFSAIDAHGHLVGLPSVDRPAHDTADVGRLANLISYATRPQSHLVERVFNRVMS